MKKIITLLFSCLLSATAFTQVFNTGQTLDRKQFVVGLNPAIYLSGPSHGINLLIHGGYGLKPDIDLAVKIGLGSEYYFGADVEWGLLENISLTTGLHMFNDFGLDATLNLTLPIRGDVYLYSGFDMDIAFGNRVYLPCWIPIGVEIELRNNMSFILEGDIGLTDSSYHIINGGIRFYL